MRTRGGLCLCGEPLLSSLGAKAVVLRVPRGGPDFCFCSSGVRALEGRLGDDLGSYSDVLGAAALGDLQVLQVLQVPRSCLARPRSPRPFARVPRRDPPRDRVWSPGFFCGGRAVVSAFVVTRKTPAMAFASGSLLGSAGRSPVFGGATLLQRARGLQVRRWRSSLVRRSDLRAAAVVLRAQGRESPSLGEGVALECARGCRQPARSGQRVG